MKESNNLRFSNLEDIQFSAPKGLFSKPRPYTYQVGSRHSPDTKNTKKYTRVQKKRYNFQLEAFTLTLNISAKTLSNTTIKDSFEISSSRGFRKCPWLLDLIKIWLRYWGLKRRLPFENRQLFFGRACIWRQAQYW